MFIIVKDINESGLVYVKQSEIRPDIQLGFNGVEGYIPIEEWRKISSTLQYKPRLIVVHEIGVKEKIDAYVDDVDYDVSFRKNIINVKLGKNGRYWDVASIPGMSYNRDKRICDIPKAEAWRLFSNLSDRKSVRWTPEVLEFVHKQIENRNSIDKIATAKDWEYNVELGGGVKLRPFQRVSAAFVEATEGKALLALEMGLGKTVISLAIAKKNNWRTLVICPATLKANWLREIWKLTNVRAKVYSGIEPQPFDIVQMLTDKTQFSIINYDIIGRNFEHKTITTDSEGHKHEKTEQKYLWVEAINMAKFDCIIFDESHYIKNVDSQRSQGARRIKSEHIIHMTGTPVLNRPGELWPILTTLKPDVFPSQELFLHQYTKDGFNPKNIDELKSALKSVMLRRRQADVVDDIPPLNRIEDYHELSKKALDGYKLVLQGVYQAIEELNISGKGDESAVTNILVQIQRLKQICAVDKIESTADLATELQISMNDSPHNKVLIFSQFKPVCHAISRRLGHEALSFVRVGNEDWTTIGVDERDAMVQQFQNDPKIKFLCVTEKTAKEGHNITKAGAVIFNDLFWTPASHQQGEGRAYMRVSDPHGISAYYRIVESNGGEAEIEEWIWKLLAAKMNMIEQTVEGVESSRIAGSDSVVMELIQKLKETMTSYKRK